jgi:hypothetical protein
MRPMLSRSCSLRWFLLWMTGLGSAGCGMAAERSAQDPGAASPPAAPVAVSAAAEPEVARQVAAVEAAPVPAPSAPAEEEAKSQADESAQAAPKPGGAPDPGHPPPEALQADAARDRAELVRARRMLDIEATLRIEVEQMAKATEALRQLVRSAHGEITNESLTEEDGAAPHADFTLRVQVEGAYDFMASLSNLGTVRVREVQARDIGKQYYDSVLRLRNLEVTRQRLEQILEQAHTVDEVLRVESELTRVRGEMEQIKGELRFLEDRAALATLHIALFTHAEQQAAVVTPQAQIYPGLRGAYLLDIDGDGDRRGYYGGGLVLGFSRRVGIVLEGYRRTQDSNGTLDAFMAVLAGRFYSQYLGGDSEPWMSPFLGLSGGYARFEGRDELALGGALGLDIWKNELCRVDVAVDARALLGSKAGPHLVMLPSLGVDVAF